MRNGYHYKPLRQCDDDHHSSANGHLQTTITPPAARIAATSNYCCNYRYLFYLGVVGCLCLLAVYIYAKTLDKIDYRLYYTSNLVTQQDDECHLPQLDPWDPSLSKFLSTPNRLQCKKLQPELSWLDQSGWLHFNVVAASEAGYSNLECAYLCFFRNEGVDDYLVVKNEKNWTVFDNQTQVGCEFIEVKCSRNFPLPVVVYSNLHNQIVPVVDRALPDGAKLLDNYSMQCRRRPDVHLFVLDSVSHSNFIRQLPKTLSCLKDKLQAIVFDAYVKVGDNSFPNAIAFLAGLRSRVEGLQSDREAGAEEYFDDWPLIWKDFAAKSYLTMLAEDYPEWNLFSYLSKGFKFSPTTHFFRPFQLSLWYTFLHRRSTHLCFGNTPKHMLQLNYLRQFLTKYTRPDDRPKFSLSWFNELGHDWLNQIHVGDDDLADFFADMTPYFNNSLLVILSDHGHRFDAIRESVIGRLESRMPFFAISLPEWMRNDYPQIVSNLKSNSKTLTTPYDLHATMLDVIRCNFSDVHLQRNFSLRGSSLLRPIGPKRNCVDASIPEDFCVCQQENAVNVTDVNVRRAADVLLRYVNDLLAKEYAALCERLQLKEIKSAQTFLPNFKMIVDPMVSFFYGGKNPTGFYMNYRIMLQASPSDAILEGMVRYSVRDDSFAVIGEVDRINRYGNQSHCINSFLLRKYCYCTEQMAVDGGATVSK